MPFIRESLDDVHEPKAAPEGEYDLRIQKATQSENSKGDDMITAWIAFDDGTDAPMFAHYILSWNSDMEKQQIERRRLDFKRFCACFDVPEDFEVADLSGAVAHAYLTQEVGNDDIIRNRLRLPRLKE